MADVCTRAVHADDDGACHDAVARGGAVNVHAYHGPSIADVRVNIALYVAVLGSNDFVV